MKKIYTRHTLNEFFEEFKKLPNSYKIEQVHQLLNNPNAKATHKVNSHFKFFKLIIMTSAFIIGITALLFLNTPVEQVKMESTSDGIIEHIEYTEIKIGKSDRENISDSVSSEIEKKSSKSSKIMKVYEKLKAENSFIVNTEEVENKLDSTSNKQSINKKEIIEVPLESDGILEKEIPTIEVPILKLTKPEMENLGFVFYKDSVVFTFNDNCNKFISAVDSFILDLTKDSAKIIDEEYLTLLQFEERKSKGINQFTIHTIHTITKVCGKMSLDDNTQILIRALTNYNNSQFTEQIWSFNEDMKDGYYPVMKTDDVNLNLLVPIKCSSKDSNVKLMFNNSVFWMYPNDELFLRLPKRLSKKLQQEFNMLSSENLSVEKVESSCTYFEICKSTLHLENFKLYPNPAKYSVTIDFNLDAEVEGSISIYNIGGTKLKILVPNSTFLSGHNSYQMDLSGITPGIYLISINTDRGFKTQRLIVSQ